MRYTPPTNPIEVVWHQTNDAVAYAKAVSTPYSTKQVVDNANQLVFNTGIFTADFWGWKKRVSDDKVIPHLKSFFAAAHTLKTIRVPLTAPYTTLPQNRKTGNSSKRRWKPLET